MKYKVGDRVKIQSLERYNKYKNRYGNINYGCETEILFTSEMSSFCGQVATITKVRYIGCVRFYHLAEDKETHLWVDGMFEKLVERNGKTYPYKIGDRVVLKGNNRCATITDLKYNSWGNLSYYVKIDNDKDISIDYPTDLLLPYDNKIKGFLEDETIPKFKVGDKITNGNVTLTILSLLSDRYVVEDTFRKCGTLYFNSQDEWKIVEEETKPEYEDEKNGEAKPKYEDEVNGEFHSTTKYLVRPSGYQFVDENGNVINAMKIVLEKKKPEYPKTYNECAEIMNCPIAGPSGWLFTFDVNIKDPYYRKIDILMGKFTRLLICRDAYWKLYGEEMGLGKPWKPDWTNQESPKYCIAYIGRQIKTAERYIINTILSFPTSEMRDAFYENFKEEIESCKELL